MKTVGAVRILASIQLLFFLAFSGTSYSQSRIILEGNYLGKNLFVQNPDIDSTGHSTCIDSVVVNGIHCKANITYAAFEIKLDSLGYNLGAPLKVIIFHKDSCKPKVLNPGGARRSPFNIIKIGFDSTNVLRWTRGRDSTYNNRLFLVEQFRWNKWVKVGEVRDPDTLGGLSYSFEITNLHSGKNKFRLKQTDQSRRPYYTNSVKVLNDVPTVTFNHDYELKTLSFSRATRYEVYDAYGNMIEKGYDDTIHCSRILPGTYYLNYDGEMDKFLVKKSEMGENHIVWERRHDGENMYIQNPFAGSGVGFCVTSVWVNRKYCFAEINSSAFEIKLDSLGYAVGDPLKIVIFHKGDCKPRFLWPMHRPRRCAEIISFKIDHDNVVRLTIGPDPYALTLFIVEQFRWNKWVKIGDFSDPDTSFGLDFSFKVTGLHSGVNKIRLKQVTYSIGNPFCTSKALEIISDLPAPSFSYVPERKTLIFSRKTRYEIYDSHENIVKIGMGSAVDCSKLKRGTYRLNYDRVTSELIIGKPRKTRKP